MLTERRLRFAEVLILAASFGCGGRTNGAPLQDGGTSGPCSLASGLDDNLQLNQLGSDDVTRYCSAERAFLECEMGPSLKPVLCTLLGLATASLLAPTTTEELRSACQNAFAACTTNPVTWRCAAEKAATCAATIAQVTSCSEDLVAQLVDVRDLDSCDKVTLETLPRLSSTMRPLSCQAIDPICPKP
jgi:hypothetical protein